VLINKQIALAAATLPNLAIHRSIISILPVWYTVQELPGCLAWFSLTRLAQRQIAATDPGLNEAANTSPGRARSAELFAAQRVPQQSQHVQGLRVRVSASV
jgi:hypothetical protein